MKYQIIMAVLSVTLVFALIFRPNKTEEKTEPDNSLLSRLPVGASIIGEYCNASRSDKTCFVKWKFMGECFMSMDIRCYTAVLTKINCPQSDSTKSTKDSQ